MKKNLMVNIIIVISFILLDPLLHFCAQWADTYNLGAEMVLGMVIPVIFAVLALVIICSIVYSFYLCVAQKNIKNIIPILVFLLTKESGKEYLQTLCVYFVASALIIVGSLSMHEGARKLFLEIPLMIYTLFCYLGAVLAGARTWIRIKNKK